MDEQFSRTEQLIGRESLQKLRSSKIAVFGIGGVGGHIVEALARCGVGTIHIFDGDTVSLSNLNRQIVALHSTLGMLKVDVMKERVLDIDPSIRVIAHPIFYTPDNADSIDVLEFDYIADAVDNVTAKIELCMRAKANNIPIISAMGAGNKLSPAHFKITDIYETRVCPLARVMRRELRQRGVDSLKVVYSDEEPSAILRTPASIAFMPSVMGLMIAGEIVRDIIEI